MADTFALDTDQLGALPIINAFCDRLGLDRLLQRFVATMTPGSSSRLRMHLGWWSATC